MRMLCRAAAIAAAAATMAGCVTDGGDEWSEWQRIDAAQRIVPYDPEALGATIEQARVTRTGDVQEVWEWQGGTIYASKAGYARYFPGKLDADGFRETMAGWGPLENLGIEAGAVTVREARNDQGLLLYAVEDASTQEATCFLFMQSYRDRPLADYQDNTNAIAGFIMGISCGNRAPGADDALAEAMLSYLGA